MHNVEYTSFLKTHTHLQGGNLLHMKALEVQEQTPDSTLQNSIETHFTSLDENLETLEF